MTARSESAKIFSALAAAAKANGDYEAYLRYRDCARRLRGVTTLIKHQRYVRSENQNVRDANAVQRALDFEASSA